MVKFVNLDEEGENPEDKVLKTEDGINELYDIGHRKGRAGIRLDQ